MTKSKLELCPNILHNFSILSAEQLAVCRPFSAFVSHWQGGKAKFPDLRPAETIDSSCAPINSNWAGRFFRRLLVSAPPKGFRFQLEQAHGGKGTDCESKKQCWIQWRWGVVATEKSIFQEGLLSSWVGFGWREITV